MTGSQERSALLRQHRAGSIGQLRVAVLSTFPPRQCGLATFAFDLAVSLRASGVGEVQVVALNRTVDRISDAGTATPRDVPGVQFPIVATISDQEAESYRNAARSVSKVTDLVIVEHEFGIFGGDDGSLLLEFLQALDVPYMMTLHTVLPKFTPGQSEVLRLACADASAVTVFTATAKKLLVAQDVAAANRIHVVAHGAPAELYGVDRGAARDALGVDDRFVLSSFGLVSPGKGLELAIESLIHLVDTRPDAVLIIAGRTHPEVLRRDGESYRQSLVALVDALGLGDRVQFLDGFLSIEAIGELLAATDVFLTPYVNEDQIVSGALTFALAAGCAVVSTPYLYAVDQLSTGAGLLVNERHPDMLAKAISMFASDDTLSADARRRSAAIGASMRWSAVGERIAQLCASLVHRNQPLLLPIGHDTTNRQADHGVLAMPGPSRATAHLRRMVDRTGIIQHATGTVALRSSGYCVDDVARLVPVATRASCLDPSWDVARSDALAFLLHAHQPGSALMSNFMGWDGNWLDAPHFGDHVGRALLGVLDQPLRSGEEIMVGGLVRDVLTNWPERPTLHPDAFALIAQFRAPQHADLGVAETMLGQLRSAFDAQQGPGWRWPEARIRYDHARLPHAMIAGGALLHDDDAIEIGLQSLWWYSQRCDLGSHLRFPGHLGLGRSDSLALSGDEQPLEALALCEAHMCAESVTGDQRHRQWVLDACRWFLGRNRLGIAMGDLTTGACFDGLAQTDVNHNCGAESTLAFMSSQQLMHLAQSRTTEEKQCSPESSRQSSSMSPPTQLPLRHLPIGTAV